MGNKKGKVIYNEGGLVITDTQDGMYEYVLTLSDEESKMVDKYCADTGTKRKDFLGNVMRKFFSEIAKKKRGD